MNNKFKLPALILLLCSVTLIITGEGLPDQIKIKKETKSDRPLKILTLGDSNGALKEGWVYQLKKIRPNDTIYNISVSGNTIGYNNLGRTSLNTLSNIGDYMKKAYERLGKIDNIILMLGTNDCKAIFKDSISFVPANMRKLLIDIKKIAGDHTDNPVIFLVSPPPFGPDELVGEKYSGGLERVTRLNEELLKISLEEDVRFINTFGILLPVFRNITSDGVHLNPDGQKMIALIIQENLKYLKTR